MNRDGQGGVKAPHYFILYEAPKGFFDWSFDEQKADLNRRILKYFKKAVFVDGDNDEVILDDDDSFVEAIKVITENGRLCCRAHSPKANTFMKESVQAKSLTEQPQELHRKVSKNHKDHTTCYKNCSLCGGSSSSGLVCLKKKCDSPFICNDCADRHATDHPMLKLPENMEFDFKKVSKGVNEVLKTAVKGKKKMHFKLLSKSSTFKNDQLVISWKLKNRGNHSETGLKIKFVESILDPVRNTILLPKIGAKTITSFETALKLDKKRLLVENEKINPGELKPLSIDSKWVLVDDRNNVEDIVLHLRDSTPIMLLTVDAKEKTEPQMPEPEDILHHNEAPTAHIVANCSEEQMSHFCHLITDKPVVCQDSVQLIKEDDTTKMDDAEQIIKEFSCSLEQGSNAASHTRHSSLGNESLISVKSIDENISSSMGFEDADNHLDDKDFADMYQSALIDNDQNSDSTAKGTDFDDFSVHSHVSNDDSDVEILNVSNENSMSDVTDTILLKVESEKMEIAETSVKNACQSGELELKEVDHPNVTESSESKTRVVCQPMIQQVNENGEESNAEVPIMMANEGPSMMTNLNQVLDDISCENVGQTASIAQETLENEPPSRETTNVLNFESSNVFEQQIREEAASPRSPQAFEIGNAKLTEFLSKVLRTTSHAFENVSVASSQAFAAVNDALEAIQNATRPPEMPLPRPFVPQRTSAQQPQMAEIAADVLLHQAWVPKSTQTGNAGEDVNGVKKSIEETLTKSEKDLCDFVRKSRTLKELGFTDDARNAQLLIQYNGDLNHVIDDLLASSSASVSGSN